ncbi:MAG: AraC family transcriptional regulator [Ketobacteraceae bacterium]|nr:AraC family transcriptional regulator [Ketobacteraceae bacterium]
MLERHEISMPMIRTILALLTNAGVDVDAFLKDIRMDRSKVERSNERINIAVYDRVQEKAMEVLDDPALGLHMGERTSPSALGLLGHLLISAPTILDSFRLFFKYHRLVSDAEPSELSVEGEYATLTYDFPRSTPVCNRIRAEFGLVQVGMLGRSMLGTELNAVEVRFEHEPTAYLDEYQRVFNAPILFNQPRTQIVFPVSILRRSLLHSDATMHALLMEEADKQLEQLRGRKTIADEVEQFLLHSMEDHKPTINRVADHFGINERTLRRKLESQETSFSELLGKVQCKYAKNLLKDTRVPVESIAERLRFSEPSAFYRAFKRWTGLTPAEYRDRVSR